MLFEILRELPKIDWSIVITSSICYFFLYMGAKKNDCEGQSFFSWGFWLILDTILFFIYLISKDGGKPMLMLVPSIIGSIFICFLFIKKKKYKWGVWETISVILIIITATVWFFSADKNSDIAIVFGVASQVIAGIPMTIECIENPKPKWNLPGFIFYLIACFIMLIFEGNAFKDFVLETHLLPALLGLQTVVEIFLLSKKAFINHLS